MVTKVQYEAEIERADIAVELLRITEEKLSVAQTELAIAAETIEDLERRVTWARKSADREHKRAAAANIENERLKDERRKARWALEALEREKGADVYNSRLLEEANKRLRLIRDIANITSEDYARVSRESRGIKAGTK
jgi:hypothetical protein